MKNFSGSNFDNRFAGELGWCDFFVAKLNEQTNKKAQKVTCFLVSKSRQKRPKLGSLQRDKYSHIIFQCLL